MLRLIMKFVSYYEYISNEKVRDYIDKNLSSESADDMQTFDYLYYDFSDDMHGSEEDWSYAYCKTFAEIKDEVKALIKKYNFKSKLLLKGFEKGFNDWKAFYKEVNEIFNVMLQKNNIDVDNI